MFARLPIRNPRHTALTGLGWRIGGCGGCGCHWLLGWLVIGGWLIASAPQVTAQPNAVQQEQTSLKNQRKLTGTVCMPRMKPGKRGDVQSKCYPKYEVKRQDLQTKCYPKYQIKRQDLQTKCYPKYQIKRQDLQNKCLPWYTVKHKDLQTKCYPKYKVKHKSFDKYQCGTPQFCHTPLHKYKVPCGPNEIQTGTLHIFAHEVQYYLQNNKKFCKINQIYSGLSAGMLVDTRAYGPAVVVDFVVDDKTLNYVRYVNGDSTKVKKHKKKYPGVKKLVVLAINPKKPNAKDGSPNLKKYTLSALETKQLMMQSLVRQKNYLWLVRMYPEERQNLQALIAKFTDPPAD